MNRSEFYQAMWPTPSLAMVAGYTVDPEKLAARTSAGGNRRGHEGNELLRQVHMQMWPTPDVGMAKVRGAASADGRSRLGGTLNPPWVEWLMGWPIGWTDLEPLETGRFRRWLNAHGKS
jgi:hypothetical protein